MTNLPFEPFSLLYYVFNSHMFDAQLISLVVVRLNLIEKIVTSPELEV